MRTLPLAAAVILVGTTFICLCFVSEGSIGVGTPAVEITIAPARQSVDVEPVEDFNGILIFSGTVTVIVPWSPSVQYLVVDLEAMATNGSAQWPTSTIPTLTFSENVNSQSYQVTVDVPPETTVYPQGVLEVSGRWRYSPGALGGSVAPVDAFIDIVGYYGHSIAPLDSIKELYRSDEAEFEVLLSNEGNTFDTYRFMIENRNELNNREVYVTVVDTEVPPLSEVVVKVKVTTSSTTTRGNHEIELKSFANNASLAGDPDESRVLTLDLRVLSGEKPSDEPDTGPDTGPDEPEEPDDEAPADDDGGNDEGPVEEGGDDGGFPVAGFFVAVLLVLIIVVVGVLAYIFGRRED